MAINTILTLVFINNNFDAFACYNMLMQPDQEQKYPEKNSDSDEPNDIREMYQPQDSQDDQLADSVDESDEDDENLIHWSASEYISNEKNSLWFIVFSIVVLGLIAVDIFLIKSYTFSVLVAVMAMAVIVFSRRPPRIIDYTMTGQGLYVGERLYHFSEFKSFGVISEDNQHSLMLIPVKRFSLGVTVYFPYEAGEKIVDILGARLPMENLKLDIIDIIVRKLRL